METTIALEELPVVRVGGLNLGFKSSGIQKLGDVDIPEEFFNRIYTDIEPFDNLVNGIVPGSVFTLGASRGCGKTTLLLQVCSAINKKYGDRAKTLFMTNEEDLSNLAYTAERLGTTNVDAGNCEYLEEVLAKMEDYRVVVVDSLSGLNVLQKGINKSDVEVHSVQQIYRKAKQTKTTVFLTLHMNKGGTATIGKTGVEHCVDACMKMYNLDPEDFPQGKKIVVDKNRTGSCGELWVKMGPDGFDFDAGIIEDKSGNDKDNKAIGHGGVRAARKIQEMNNLLTWLKEVPFITEKDIPGWKECPTDITGLDRTVRLLKSLIKYGKVIKNGDRYEIVR